MTQREKPEPTLDAMRQIPGALVSGGKIEAFREGWAKAIFAGGDIGHYFRRHSKNIGQVHSVCGTLMVTPRQIYGIGNYPKCQLCQKYLRKRGGIP